MAKGRAIHGWEVDRVAREMIRKAGYAKYFVHRTGHSIGQEVHGNGANMDGLETRDDRKIVPHTCFSIEPGIYLPEFGIRSEVNVYVGETRSARDRRDPGRDSAAAGLIDRERHLTPETHLSEQPVAARPTQQAAFSSPPLLWSPRGSCRAWGICFCAAGDARC